MDDEQRTPNQELVGNKERIAIEKRRLRQQILQNRQQVDAGEQQRKSELIRQHFLDWLDLHPISKGKVIALYASIQGEADVLPLLAELAKRGIDSALPRTERATRHLTFHLVSPRDTLIAGTFGILEPSVNSRQVPVQAVGVFLVPGIAFTPEGLRLGYGGGYYDRWFGGPAKDAVRIGVALRDYVVPSLPVEAHDQFMHYILTEQGVTACQ